MVFSSGTFMFIFLPLLLIIYYSAKSRIVRNYILLITSLIFYSYGEPAFVFIMLASIFINWLLALAMSVSSRPKLWLGIAVTFDILLLAVFKYANFVSGSIAALSGHEAVSINLALPIGISFFTFQMMSYIFDVYYGTSTEHRRHRKTFRM